MQLHIYTAYAVIFLCSTPLYRLCGHSFVQSFHAVVLLRCHAFLCGRSLYTCLLYTSDAAFTQSRFYAAEPFTQAHFTQLRYLCSHAFCAVLDGNGSQGNGSEGGSWEPCGWPCPCAALWVSRPSQHDPPPAGRRRWNPGRIFHGWRPWCAPVSPAFPAAGRPPGPPTDPAAGRSRRCR